VEALVADLESVDAVEEEVRPLRELAAGLGRVAVSGGVGPVELERVRERVLAVLRAFATQGGPDVPGGRQGWEASPGARDPGFWKR
jgi:hypothetical protein